MQVTINIPDTVYQDLSNMNKDIEGFILEAVKIYAERKKLANKDPLHKWLQSPVPDKEGKTDLAENHDKYLYGFKK